QVGVAGTKPSNIQTALSTQLRGNPDREPKVEKKGGRTPVREQNKGGDSCAENLSLGSNGGNITTSTQLRKGGKNNSQSGDMETNKGSGIHIKGVFQLYKREYSEKRLQKRLRICPFSGLREEEIAYTEKLEKELRENIIEETNSEQDKLFN
ncbi:MAG: hypothetical protein EZS28_055917, partial [Streblomastix strix]